MSMVLSTARVCDEEAASVLALLQSNGLPTEGLLDHLDTTLVVRHGAAILGSAALEVYPDGALLRSVAVSRERRGEGLARMLTEAAIALAEQLHMPAMFLLTTTAEGYFPAFGFERVERDDVPQTVRTSVEFTAACPASATVMRRQL